jgi:hypothetical protein
MKGTQVQGSTKCRVQRISVELLTKFEKYNDSKHSKIFSNYINNNWHFKKLFFENCSIWGSNIISFEGLGIIVCLSLYTYSFYTMSERKNGKTT